MRRAAAGDNGEGASSRCARGLTDPTTIVPWFAAIASTPIEHRNENVAWRTTGCGLELPTCSPLGEREVAVLAMRRTCHFETSNQQESPCPKRVAPAQPAGIGWPAGKEMVHGQRTRVPNEPASNRYAHTCLVRDLEEDTRGLGSRDPSRSHGTERAKRVVLPPAQPPGVPQPPPSALMRATEVTTC